jgi:hypothetical protein
MARSSGLRQRREVFIFWIDVDRIIWKKNLMVFTIKELISGEFISGGLHEDRAVATWNIETSKHLLQDGGNPRKPVSSWTVAGPSGCAVTSSQQSGKQKVWEFP